jgi:hypothetical protein
MCSSEKDSKFTGTFLPNPNICRRDWKGLEGTGRDWKGLEGTGRDWKGLEGTGRDWK